MHFDSTFPFSDQLYRATSIPDLRLGLPANIGLERNHIGNAVGFGENVYLSALGEFVERHHFTNFVRIDRIDKIEIISNKCLKKSLFKLFEQTSKISIKEIIKKSMKLTYCVNFFDYKKTYMPSCLLFLNNDEQTYDKKLIPFMDSSGCAAHSLSEEAINRSLLEFIERQTFLASWFSENSATEINLQNVIENKLSKINPIWNFLSETGKITCFYIDVGLKCPVVFSIFESNNECSTVQFSCGLASHWHLKNAIEKSIMELWHNFISTPIKMKFKNTSTNKFDKNFLMFNKKNIRNKLKLIKNNINKIDLFSFKKIPNTKNNSLRIIESISKNLFFYQEVETIGESLFILAKIFSPDFFIHMDPAEPLNFDNAFMQYLQINPVNIPRISTCIP